MKVESPYPSLTAKDLNWKSQTTCSPGSLKGYKLREGLGGRTHTERGIVPINCWQAMLPDTPLKKTKQREIWIFI